MKIKEYSVKKFLDKFRPAGTGRIFITFDNGSDVITFKEIICDYCNAMIWDGENEDDKENKSVYVTEYSEAICEECAKKYKCKDN